MEEYLEVIHRPKFSQYPDFVSKAEFVLVQIELKSTQFNPSQHIDLIADDADNRLLELAEESNADFLITGNTNDFIMTNFKGTKIVNPKDYWEIFRE